MRVAQLPLSESILVTRDLSSNQSGEMQQLSIRKQAAMVGKFAGNTSYELRKSPITSLIKSR